MRSSHGNGCGWGGGQTGADRVSGARVGQGANNQRATTGRISGESPIMSVEGAGTDGGRGGLPRGGRGRGMGGGMGAGGNTANSLEGEGSKRGRAQPTEQGKQTDRQARLKSHIP